MTRKDILAFAFLSIGWGTSFYWVKIALEEVGPITMVAVRMLIGAATMALVAYFRRPERWPNRREWWALFWVALADFSLPLALTTWGQLYIDSGVAALLISTVPLFTVVVVYVFLRDERGNPTQWLGVLIGFLGVFVLLSRDLALDAAGSLFGFVSHLLAAALYAVSTVILRSQLSKAPLVYQTLFAIVLGDLMIWPLALALESPITLPSSGLIWVAVIWQGLIASALATLVYYYLVHSVGPTRASMVAYLLPVVAVAMGVLLLNEAFDLQLVLGSALVLGSIAVVNRA